ncbi:MAG: GNAT family N-acetyltransferase [Clostridiales bacterium]|jgi:GNAT superfamily N-acetyltransferase|nr:GNAT family N-acetyltransferase [Clostridiales bacterium]
MEIRQADSRHPDFLMLKEKLEDFLDGEYKNYDTPRREYRKGDEDIDLTAVYIAYDNDAPIAISGFKMKDPTTAELKKVFVLPERTGGGIATNLVSLVENAAKSAGAESIVLKTGKPLRSAISLYLRLGYEFTPGYPPYQNDETAICMKKSLE